jgi:hypothetical protein
MTNVRHWRIFIHVFIYTHVYVVETSIFTKKIQTLLNNEDYQEFQIALVNRPSAGVIIPGSGGLRKVRWARPGSGKRGGVRVIYYWAVKEDQILMLFVFAKNEQDDLLPNQLRILRKLIEDEYP